MRSPRSRFGRLVDSRRHCVEPSARVCKDGFVDSDAVVFDNVSFAFDDHVVLKDISFSVPKGSMRIMIGASGAGKSIVVKLILGLLRLTVDKLVSTSAGFT